MISEEFLELVLPDDYGDHNYSYCIFGLEDVGNGKSKSSQFWTSSIADAAKIAKELDAKKVNAYYAIADYKKDVYERYKAGDRKGLRTSENVCRFSTLSYDIDVGKKNNSYDELSKALSELKRVTKENNLPIPLIVGSGSGLHIHYCLDNPIVKDQWLSLAGRLKTLFTTSGLIIDPVVSTDASRVLRVVGTHNYKNKGKVPVTVLFKGDAPHTYEFWDSLLGSVEGEKVEEVEEEPQVPDVVMEEEEFIPEAHISYSFTTATKKCMQLKYLIENPKEQPEPLWWAALSIAKYCDNSKEAIKVLSDKYPGYDPEETRKKVEGIKGKPHTCKKFEMLNPDLCVRCSYKDAINSPIALAKTLKGIDAPIPVTDTSDRTGSIIDYEIPVPPKPFTYIEGEGVYQEGPPEKGSKQPSINKVYDYALFVEKRLEDAQDGMLAQIRFKLPKDGTRDFIVSIADLNSTRKFDVLSKYGIIADNEKQKGRIMVYLNSWLKFLEKTEKLTQAYNQMGWGNNGQSFVLGDREFTAGGCKPTPKNMVLSRYSHKFSHVGELDKWRHAIHKLYARDGEECRRFVLGFGLACPLFKYTNVNGGLLHLRSDGSGKSKSATILSANSIWGHPKGLAMKGADTPNSWLQRLGIYQSIPLCIDEITNLDPREASKFVYTLSDGEGINRLKGSENAERINNIFWQTGTITTANSSLTDLLTSEKATPEGELMRMLQFEFEDNNLTDEENGEYVSTLFHNHGVAAEVIVPYLIGHPEESKARVHAMIKRIREDGKFTNKERFWVAMAGIGMVGVELGNDLGIWDFDIQTTYEWLLQELINQKKTPKGMVKNAEESLSMFLTEHLNSTLIIMSKANRRDTMSFNEEDIIHRPTNSIVVRDEPDTNQMFIHTRALRNWCTKKQIDYNSMVSSLRSRGVCHKKATYVRLGTGFIKAPSLYCLTIDSGKFDVPIGDQKDEGN